ncbi:MAG: PilT/PilU family type 4a pilus ATPase [Nanoarchaeota archaeon]|nr:PilT/PilU family type 4a pilus ATPase [Nanoarchaeota archaeon]
MAPDQNSPREMQIDKLLGCVVDKGASDLHIKVGYKPYTRLHGELHSIETQTVDQEIMHKLLRGVLDDSRLAEFQEKKNMDSSLILDIPNKGKYRFRINVAQASKNPYISIRAIPEKIIDVRNVGFPFDVWQDIINLHQGLVLVTGTTGSGKTTTLASLIEEINKTANKHIVTIEDPVEYLYTSKKSIISQRELGVDVDSFYNGVKFSLRQDPDIVLVGEIRDRETAEKALESSSTGHVVFSTLHTNNAAETVSRYVNLFEVNDHANIRNLLASNLKYVLSQKLIPYKKGAGRTLAMEVLNVGASAAIRKHLREGEYHQIMGAMQTAKTQKTITMDARLEQLVADGKITEEDAIEHAYNPDALRSKYLNK